METEPPAPTGMMNTAVSQGEPSGAVKIKPVRPTRIDPKPIRTGVRAPNRLVSGPLTRLPGILSSAEGRKASPAHSGASPRCCCRYRLVKNTVPYQAAR